MPPFALFVGMNPSTAEADVDDPTIRRDLEFCRAWGLRGYVKANVGDYRATKPKMLSAPGVVAVSPENIPIVLATAKRAERVVMAFGVPPKPLIAAAEQITHELVRAGHELLCLGKTAAGWPRHTLYLLGETPLERWSWPR